ncbi:hypothetical protein NSK_006275 [Nannochloropsis salina CCMP1776]|uniref:Uncharacterized protein n=1 Tax=Nannochloropsis salina CCMP1776 TaxID=1027361 RepID=A0A4D9D173_9STRA|nr:hypothetical protein NSK_006275 [Nannochloropsis salina CCMP1776]|eukprot:TFJ82408.1 hypothetical protein NSK_006275 [Nannochloropsis salina CCMP1776]
MAVRKHKKSYHEIETDEEMEEELGTAAQDPDIYDRLARSIAPEISLLDDEEDENRDSRDDMSKVYSLILDYMQGHRLARLEYIRAEAMVVQKGWKTEQLREMLDFYVEADVFRVSADRTMIELFNTD